MNTKAVREYFPAANSEDGFFSLFESIFDLGKFEKMYIIKGGSGTGKSRLMREVAKSAEDAGFSVEYYYCSSDPDSLDGIIIVEKKLAMVDGTAPHTRDPYFPGAVDEILNVGAFWDVSKLESERAQIEQLCEKKQAAYCFAYDFLALAGKIRKTHDKLVEAAFDSERLEAFAARFAVKIPRSAGVLSERKVFLRSISYRGITTLPTFQNYERRFVIDGGNETPRVVMKALYDVTAKRGGGCTVALDPLDHKSIDALGFECANMAITGSRDFNAEGEVIRTARFIDSAKLRELRGELRRLEKMHTECIDTAVRYLKEAFDFHSKLEDVYSEAMDFSAKEAFTDEFIKRLDFKAADKK